MRTLRQVLRAPDRWTYSDLGIAPLRDEELDTLDLYHETSGGVAAVARVRREAEARARVAATGRFLRLVCRSHVWIRL
jgi:hypothetical protein